MSKPFLYFERLKNAYTRSVFTENFGTYLFSLNQAHLLDLMIEENSEFNPSRAGAYILKLNENAKDPYVTEYIESILAADKKDILLFLQEKSIDDSRKFEMLVKNIIVDINNIIKAIDKLKWLKHNTVIEKYLTELTLELKSNYLNISFNVTDSDFKPLVWEGDGNVLANLFYQLYKVKTNSKGKFLISAKKEELADFICKAFVKPDNTSFTRSSVLRDLNGDRTIFRNPIDID